LLAASTVEILKQKLRALLKTAILSNWRIYMLYNTLPEYWLFLLSIFYVFISCEILYYVESMWKYPFVFHNIHRVCIVESLQKYLFKEKARFMHRSVSDLPNQEILFFNLPNDIRSKQKEPSLVSGIICRHISAGHLNCNIWSSPSPTAISPRTWCQHRTGRLWHIQY